MTEGERLMREHAEANAQVPEGQYDWSEHFLGSPPNRGPHIVGMTSGCFDIIRAGHIEHLRQCAALCDRLVVSIAGDKALWIHKQRKPAMPAVERKAILEALPFVHEVVISDGEMEGLNFLEDFHRIRPHMFIALAPDKYEQAKRQLCRQVGCEYKQVERKRPAGTTPSTTEIRRRITAPVWVPLRVDFAGGWLDVPRLGRNGGYIVNCAIQPLVRLDDDQFVTGNGLVYQTHGAGLGGSAAHAVLTGRNAHESELDIGAGWQDSAIISETGLCVWRSGDWPVLEFKDNPYWLEGLMGLYWTQGRHLTPDLAGAPRDYTTIVEAGQWAAQAVRKRSLKALGEAVRMSYWVQWNSEGMTELPTADGEVARKYCGGGHGGYALYLFGSKAARKAWVEGDVANRIAIEPYLREA